MGTRAGIRTSTIFRGNRGVRAMFRITSKKGFSVTFKNGYMVSVQFGPANYCDNYEMSPGRDEQQAGEIGSETAETAVIDSKNNFIEYEGKDVQGYRTPEQVLELLNWASKQQEK